MTDRSPFKVRPTMPLAALLERAHERGCRRYDDIS